MFLSICSIQLYALRANNQTLPIFFCASKLENNRTVDEKNKTIMQASCYEEMPDRNWVLCQHRSQNMMFKYIMDFING